MEASRAACMLSSSSSFTNQHACSSSTSSSRCSSAGSRAAVAFNSTTPLTGKNAGQSSRRQQADRCHPMAIIQSPGSGFLDANNGPTTSAQPAPASAIDFLMLCQRLKTTKRAGWVNHGLKGTESIADHMHRMAVMAIIAADIPGINKDKCVKMAVVHDIAEAIVGDITPSDGIPKEEKSRREREAIDEMCSLLGDGIGAEEVKSLWLEYENNSTLEASFVKDLDKVEMILQALEYETTQGKVLDDFYQSTTGKFQTEIGKLWAAEIIKRRNSTVTFQQ